MSYKRTSSPGEGHFGSRGACLYSELGAPPALLGGKLRVKLSIQFREQALVVSSQGAETQWAEMRRGKNSPALLTERVPGSYACWRARPMLLADDVESTSLSMLLEALDPRLRLIARRYRIDTLDAEDVLQETLLRFLRRRHSIHDPFLWLPLVFRRECLRFVRKRKRYVNGTVDLERLDTSSLRIPPDQVHATRLDLADAFEKLRPSQQRLLWWRYGLGMTEAEVAGALGCKPISAKKASSRALGAIRRAMNTTA